MEYHNYDNNTGEDIEITEVIDAKNLFTGEIVHNVVLNTLSPITAVLKVILPRGVISILSADGYLYNNITFYKESQFFDTSKCTIEFVASSQDVITSAFSPEFFTCKFLSKFSNFIEIKTFTTRFYLINQSHINNHSDINSELKDKEHPEVGVFLYTSSCKLCFYSAEIDELENVLSRELTDEDKVFLSFKIIEKNSVKLNLSKEV